MKKNILYLCLIAIAGIAIKCSDPRKNCNHPKHAEYVKEKQLKRTGLK